MKNILTLLFMVIAANSQLSAATFTVGTGGNYTSLYAAFDDINNGNITGNIELQITNNLVEVNPCVLDFSGFGGSYSSVKIYPTQPNLSITGFFWPGNLIELNGADNVTIDGRVNATGNTPSLTISYTGSSSAGNSVIALNNNATHNKIQYCNLTTNAYDIMIVSFASAQDNIGNSHNKIAHNIISGMTDLYSLTSTGIYSGTSNTTTSNNHYDSIVNNQILNFREYAIHAEIGASAWYIEGNSIYENLGNDASNANRFFYGIKTEGTNANTLGGFTIVNNYIGGSAPLCGGSAFSMTNGNAYAKSFAGISANVTFPTKVIIEGNTIQNVFTDYSLAQNPFTGIYCNGKAMVQNNMVGGANGSIQNLHGVGDPITTGINVSAADSSVINNNQVSGMKVSANTGSDGPTITGIICDGAFTTNYAEIKNNTVGSTANTNSIHNDCWTYSTGAINGIVVNVVGFLKMENNILVNFKNNSERDGSYTFGISIVKAAGGSTVINNSIHDFTGSRTLKGMKNVGHPGVLGKTIVNNTIYNLQTTYTGTSITSLMGIDAKMQFVAGVQKTKQNFIHSLSTSNGNSMTIGIDIQNAVLGSEIQNNVISMQSDSGDVYGVSMDNNVNSKFVHNTIYIQSSVSRNKRTACLYVHNNLPEVISNNIFFNGMANASGVTKNHFCVYNQSNSNFSPANFNVYRLVNQSSGGAVAYWNNTGASYSNLAQWKFITNQDTSSVTIDPLFTNAGGTAPADYYPNANVNGAAYLGVTKDYFNSTRSLNFWMGALQSTGPSIPLPLTWNSFSVTDKQEYVVLNWETTQELNLSHFEIERSQDANEFIQIATMAAQQREALSSYNYHDHDVTGAGTVYYRIKQVDIDGKFSYSPVRKIVRNLFSEVTLYPNPATTYLTIQLTKEEPTQIDIYTVTGQLVLSNTIMTSERMNINQLKAGTYILKGRSASSSFSTRFIKQ